VVLVSIVGFVVVCVYVSLAFLFELNFVVLVSGMVLLRCFWLSLFQCCVLSCFFGLSLSLDNGTKSCDPSDLSALKEFEGNLTNGSIMSPSLLFCYGFIVDVHIMAAFSFS